MGFVLLDLLFYVYVLWIVVLHFVLFLSAIALSVLLRCTDSDYPLVSSNSSYYIMSCCISCHINRYVYRCGLYVFIFVLFIIFTYYCQKKLLH
jgi:hypothetical protein